MRGTWVGRVAAIVRQRGRCRVVFEALLIVQLLHLGEHLVQMVQLHVLGWPAATARGVVSTLDVERVHFIWNLSVLATLVWLGARGLASRWLTLTLAWAALHTGEHGFLLARALGRGVEGAPGILGAGGWLAGQGWHVPGFTTWSRAAVHFAWNTGETALLTLAYAAARGAALPRLRVPRWGAARRGGMLAVVLLIPSTVSAPIGNLSALAPAEVWVDGLGSVTGVAVDAAGHLYVSDSDAGTLTQVAPDRVRTVVARGLDHPVGVALDASGHLLIAEEGAGRVVRVEPGGGRLAVASGIRRPRWLTVSARGLVFVSAQRSGPGDAMAILALHPDGRLTVFADDFKDLEALVAGDDTLFAVAKGRRGGVEREGMVFQIGIRADGSAGPVVAFGPDDRLQSPVGLARDRLGALYATAKELGTGQAKTREAIAKLHPDGAVAPFAGGLGDPQGLAFDHDGHVYVAGGRAGRVLRFRAPPAPTLDPSPAFTHQPALMVTGTAEPGARVELVANGALAPLTATTDTNGTFAVTVPLAPNADNTIEASATAHGGDGLTGPSAEIGVTHDDVAPAVVFQSPTTAGFVRGVIVIEVGASDGGSGVASVALDADGRTLPATLTPGAPAPAVTASASWDTRAAADGTHTLTALASDRAANTRSATRVVIVDNTPPDTLITAGPSGESEGTAATFTVAATDNLTPASGLAFAWRLDGAAFGEFSLATTATFAGLSDGPHTFEVKARDLAGNEDPTPAARTFTITTRPSVSALEPPAGPVGTLVTIRGRGFVPGATQVAFDGATAVVRSATSTALTVTVPIEARSGPVTVTTATGTATSPDPFTVTRGQDFSVQAVPAAAPLVQGTSTTCTISLADAGGASFTGLATLTLAGLPAGVTGVVSPAATLGPGQLRTLTLTATPSAAVGPATITVSATATVDGTRVTHSAAVTLDVLAGGRTAALGQVTLVDGTPIFGARLSLGSATTTSDAGGNFQLLDVPAGTQMLGVDANAARPGLPIYGVEVTLVAGAATQLAPFRITPPPPPERFTPIAGAGTAQVISDPRFPGASVTIPAGVTITGWDGTLKTRVAIERLSPDALPVPPPPGPTRSLYQLFFGTPMGGVPSAPLPVSVPNDQDLDPGEKAEIWYYDAAPLPGVAAGWRLAGLGTVSADGSRIVSDPGVGLSRFCGVCGVFCIVKNLLKQFNVNPKSPKAGEPVDLATGLMLADKTDLLVPGRVPAALHRRYNPQDPFGRIAGFELATGPGWTLSIDVVLLEESASVRRLILPGNSRFVFALQADGTFTNGTYPDFADAVLKRLGDGSHSLRFKDGTIWRFATGYVPRVGLPFPILGLSLLVEHTDRNGNTLTISRDRFGAPTQVTEPGGRALTFTVDAGVLGVGRLASVTDPIGRVVHYGYGASSPYRLETVTDALGGVTRYAYDARGGLLSLTDARGLTFVTNEFDADGRVVRQTQADGGVWTFAYTGPVGAHTSATVTDPRGQRTAYRMDAAGFAVEITDALGQVTRHERDAAGRIVATTDPLGRVSRFAYDVAGNLTTSTDPAGHARTFTYEPTFSRPTSFTDPLGQVTRLEYDPAGNLTAEVNPLGERTTLTYDGAGQPLAITDAMGNVSRFQYDAVGNLVASVDPAGNRTVREYDAVSRLVRRLDALGQSTTFGHDALNRIETVLDGLGGVTRFAHDPNGNVLTIIDARGGVTSYTYDAMDRLATRTDPVGATESFSYDGLGNPTRHVDRKGQVATFVYDAVNRRTSSRYADAAVDVVYDAGGRLVQAADTAGGTIVNQHDTLDRLTAQTTALGTISYQYDAAGRRTVMTAPGQPAVAYTYDAASRLTSLRPGSQLVQFRYDPAGRRTRLTLPNQVSTDYQYDPASRLTALTYRNATDVLGDLTYDYDTTGNRTAVGGSFARTLLPTPVAAATYDPANRQRTFGPTTLTYDANGNVTSIADLLGQTLLAWDARNQLTVVRPTGSPGVTTFTYDPVGRRLARTVDGAAVRYVYDGIDVVEERGSVSSATYLRGLLIDEPLVRAQMDAYVSDASGSVVALVDATGTVSTAYTYDPFGMAAATGGASRNPFDYTGRERDSAELAYYRARYYAPRLHRFLSEDPLYSLGQPGWTCSRHPVPQASRYIEIDTEVAALASLGSLSFAEALGLNPQLLHLYAYAGNNPVNKTDPTGLRAGPQTPGCDRFPDLTPCVTQCCNEHDRCYKDAPFSWCDQTSWKDLLHRQPRTRVDCMDCNIAVVKCIVRSLRLDGRKSCQ